MNVFLENIGGNLRFNYSSEYATGSMYVHTPDDLVKAIEEVCGKGSYCLYRRGPNSQRTVVPFGDENYKIYPTITYWQQGVKTGVIEQSREVAREVWGDIPEMKTGWIEDKCRTYVD